MLKQPWRTPDPAQEALSIQNLRHFLRHGGKAENGGHHLVADSLMMDFLIANCFDEVERPERSKTSFGEFRWSQVPPEHFFP